MFNRYIQALILLLAILLLLSCSSQNNDNMDTTDSVESSTDGEISFVSGIGEIVFESPFFSETDVVTIEGIPSEDDIKKYDDIMKKLQDYSKTEEEIMKSIAPDYGMTVDEMKQFMNDIMPFATGFQKFENPNEPSDRELIDCVKTVLNKIVVNGDFQISDSVIDWTIDKTNLRIVLSSEKLLLDDKSHEIILKIEFDGNYYKSFKVFQLKLDEKNIDL